MPSSAGAADSASTTPTPNSPTTSPANPASLPSPSPPSPASLASSPPVVGFPNPGSASPTASTKPLIPLLLHHGFYPYAHFKDQSVLASSSLAVPNPNDSAPLSVGIPSSSPSSPRWYQKLSKSVTDASKIKAGDSTELDDSDESEDSIDHPVLSQPLLSASLSIATGPSISIGGPTRSRSRGLHQSSEYIRSPSGTNYFLISPTMLVFTNTILQRRICNHWLLKLLTLS